MMNYFEKTNTVEDGLLPKKRARIAYESCHNSRLDLYQGGAGRGYNNVRPYRAGERFYIQKSFNQCADEARKERWVKCPPIIKDFYIEDKKVANLTPSEVDAERKYNLETTVGRIFPINATDKIPNPVQKFEQCFGPYPELLKEIRKQGFSKPSPIQAQAWPILLKGEDLVGIAQTGTGKTLAFLLPAMIHTEFQTTPCSERGGPNVLVITPTHELALQIEKEVSKYSYRDIKACCVYGGGNRATQIEEIRAGVQIIICTPGRFNDLKNAGAVQVDSITYLVLDEADRMLDLGFEPEIRRILLDIRPDRQTVMTSATWPSEVHRLAEKYMNNPIRVCVGSLDLKAVHSVKQIIEIMDEEKKLEVLKKFLQQMKQTDKVIIFCSKKIRVDWLKKVLTSEALVCQYIHSDRTHAQRKTAIADIRSGNKKVLVATDLASRGLDIEDLTHVINFEFPRKIEEYVHRVGRTGRAGRTGTSISYMTRKDWRHAKELIAILEEADQEVSDELCQLADEYEDMTKTKASNKRVSGGGRRGYGRGGNRRYGLVPEWRYFNY